jgi:uncharacterized protein YegL
MPADRVTSKSPWHLVMILDDSGSMSGPPADSLNKAVEAMVEEMRVTSNGMKPYFKLSIISFGTAPTSITTASSEQTIDLTKVTNFQGDSGSTDAAAALQMATRLLQANPNVESDFTPFVFFLSDGAPDDEAAALSAGSQLKSLQLQAGSPRLVTIGIGAPNDAFMAKLASSPELYRRLADHRDVVRFFPQIGTVAGSQVGVQAVESAIMNL